MGTRLRYDVVELDRATRRRAADGSLIVRGRFARTGLQTYQNQDGSERIEYRDAVEVERSAATFEGNAFTDLHPTSMVRPENWQQLACGHLQNITYIPPRSDSEEGWLEADFHVKRADLISEIESGSRSELSAGYYADEDETPGTYRGRPYHCAQRGITGNHVAALPSGSARAGREARLMLDSSGDQLPPWRDGMEVRMNEFEVKINGVPFRFTADQAAKAALEQAIEAVPSARADVASAKADADARVKAAESARDDALGKIEKLEQLHASLKADLADAMDPAKLDARAAVRADLINQALRLGVKRDALKRKDGEPAITDREIRVLALRADGTKVDAKASDDWIAGALEMAIRHVADGATVRDLADANEAFDEEDDSDPMQPLWDARDRYLDGKED